MDSILNKNIKFVYDKWVTINNQKQYLPNGLHPLVFKLIKDKLEVNQNLHESLNQVGKMVTGELFVYDHGNLWGYTSNIIDYIEVTDIQEETDIVYIWPLELKGSNFPSNEFTLDYNNETIHYKLHDTLSPYFFELLKQGKVKILLNLAHDPVMHYENIVNIENYFNSIGIDPSNVIFVLGNDFKDQYRELVPGAKLKISAAELLLTHQVAITISHYPSDTNLGYNSDLVREDDITDTIRPVRFICLNRTMKPHRYMLAYHALKTNLLKNNYYSFLNDFSMDEVGIAESLKRFNITDREAYSYNKIIKQMMPYHVDTQGKNEEQRCQMTWTNNKKELYLNSYINIVSETSFEIIKNPFISEKLWKPVINLQPFILVGNYHTLKKIKEMGFKTFSPFINEKYDDVYDEKTRMQLILEEINRLNALPIQQLHDWYHSIKDILVFNRNHLESLRDINPYQIVFEDIINTYRG